MSHSFPSTAISSVQTASSGSGLHAAIHDKVSAAHSNLSREQGVTGAEDTHPSLTVPGVDETGSPVGRHVTPRGQSPAPRPWPGLRAAALVAGELLGSLSRGTSG